MTQLELFTSVSSLKGVGQKTEAALASLGIHTVYDLLTYFPFRYEDLDVIPLDEISDGQKVLLKGVVVTEPVVSYFGKRRNRVSFKIRIDHAIVMVNFFNQPWVKKQAILNHELAIFGKYNVLRQELSAMKIVAQKADANASTMSPIYALNRNLRQKKLQDLIDLALQKLDLVEEDVPSWVKEKYRLLSTKQLIHDMHHPKNPAAAKLARRSAIFHEFFLYQMQLALIAHGNKQTSGYAKKVDIDELSALTTELPFELSADQKRVIAEILHDLKSPAQMQRLVQGDVGSGKTIVAVYALYAAVTAGYQACLMVPTEILASQHFKKIDELLRPLGVRVAYLSSSTKALEKREIYKELASGMINVVVGTHSLIQDNVSFASLGLVIIDEQHRFGVEQRRKLIAKADRPDVLTMTATPIPRTLAQTVYGEVAISEIRHLPAGRKPIISQWLSKKDLADVYAMIQQQLEQGYQVYAVSPLISESESLDLQNAEHLAEQLSQQFPAFQVTLLHGQMKSEQKDEIMAEFVNHQIDLLVTTSVIEVGVDVSNATLMVIFDADRFGLSQLHQLRGRIGRGQTQSYCVFVADPKTESGKQRMKIIASTNDGFKLSEEDLKMRGQGDLFGKAQSGVPDFQVGDVISNYNTLVVARQVAKQVVELDPKLEHQENEALKEVLHYLEQKQGAD